MRNHPTGHLVALLDFYNQESLKKFTVVPGSSYYHNETMEMLVHNSQVPEVKIPFIFSVGDSFWKINYTPLKTDLLWPTKLLIDGLYFCGRCQSAFFQVIFLK